MIDSEKINELGYGVSLGEILETYTKKRLGDIKDLFELPKLKKQDDQYCFEDWTQLIKEDFRKRVHTMDYDGYMTFAGIEGPGSVIEYFGPRCQMAFNVSGFVFPLLTPEGEIQMLPQEFIDVFKEEDCKSLKENSLRNKDIYSLVNGAIYLYGLIDFNRLFSLVKKNTKYCIEEQDFGKLLTNCENYHGLIAYEGNIVYSRCFENLQYIKDEQKKFRKYGYKEFRREEILEADWCNVKDTPENIKMMLLLRRTFRADIDLCRCGVGVFITNAKCCRGPEHSLAFVEIELGKVDDEFIKEFLPLHCQINNATPNFALLGHSPNEMMKMQDPALYKELIRQGYLAASSVKSQPVRKGEKTGRNEPCPCGSGKKYKNCCLYKEEEYLLN